MPPGASLKEKCRQKERAIRLNPIGRTIVPMYFFQKKPLPYIIGWRENLKRWAKLAGIGSDFVSSKTTRKTWESWLVTYYPAKYPFILQSQGHTETVSLEHYLGLEFTAHDKRDMKEFVEGWI